MKHLCLENYGVSKMETQEMKATNGGQDPDGCSGCSDGVAAREFIGNLVSASWKNFRVVMSFIH